MLGRPKFLIRVRRAETRIHLWLPTYYQLLLLPLLLLLLLLPTTTTTTTNLLYGSTHDSQSIANKTMVQRHWWSKITKTCWFSFHHSRSLSFPSLPITLLSITPDLYPDLATWDCGRRFVPALWSGQSRRAPWFCSRRARLLLNPICSRQAFSTDK